MRIVNPFLWEVPNLAALRVPSISIPKMKLGDRVLLVSVIVSLIIDMLIDVATYLDLHSTAFALIKGVILLIILANFRTAYSYVTVVLFFSIFVLRGIWVGIESQVSYPFDDATFFLRILFFAMWLLLFYEKRNNNLFLRCVLQVFIIAVIVNVLCQIAGATLHLKIFDAYIGDRGGYKGLFLSPDDTGVFYMLALLYSIHQWICGKRLILPIVLLGMVMLAIGSKITLLELLIVPLLYLGFRKGMPNVLNPLRLLRLRGRTLLLLTASGIAVAVLAIASWNYLNNSLGDIQLGQFSRVYRESGFLTALTSSRDIKVAAYLQSVRSIPDVLLGLQIKPQLVDIWADEPGNFMYEIDLFDYLARAGLIGIVITLAIIFRATGCRHWRKITPEAKTLLVTIAICGCTVGHTLISSVNGIWIAFWFVAYTTLIKRAERPVPSLASAY